MSRLFDGVDDKIETGLTAHATAGRTWLLWVKTTVSPSGYPRLFDKRTSGSEVELLWYASSTVYYYRYFSTTRGIWEIASADLHDGVWSPLIITFDESSDANDPAFYLDGTSRSVTEDTTPSGSRVTNTDPYILGNRGSQNRPFEGRMAHVAVWDRILTGTEIDALEAGANPLVYDTDLVAYWPLLTDSSTEPDEGPNGYDATVTGAAHSTDNPTVDDPPATTITVLSLDSNTSTNEPTLTEHLSTSPANLVVPSVASEPTLTQAHSIAPDSLVVASESSQPAISSQGAITPDSIVVASVSSGPVFETTTTTYGIGSPVVGITVSAYTDFSDIKNAATTAYVSSPILIQSHVDLGNPDTLIVESTTDTPSLQPPVVVEVGVSPGYPKIDEDPAVVAIDVDPTVTPVLDFITANTADLDTQQVTSVSIWTFSDNTVKLDDQPNDVRIDA